MDLPPWSSGHFGGYGCGCLEGDWPTDEGQVEGGLDLTAYNILKEWRTPGAIIEFVEARRRA